MNAVIKITPETSDIFRALSTSKMENFAKLINEFTKTLHLRYLNEL